MCLMRACMPGQVKKAGGDCVSVCWCATLCMMAHINVTSVSQMASAARRERGGQAGYQETLVRAWT
uniref:Uncharacterized protein n=1 Tax=Oryza rufipogon TaxID=4529 RepID=A0A0E0MT84_ORYRU